MTVKGRFSLDTNILVYAVDRDSGERHELARELIGRASADNNEHKNQERSRSDRALIDSAGRRFVEVAMRRL